MLYHPEEMNCSNILLSKRKTAIIVPMNNYVWLVNSLGAAADCTILKGVCRLFKALL